MPAAAEALGLRIGAFCCGGDTGVCGADKAADTDTLGEEEGEEALSSALPTTTFHTRLLPPGRLLGRACGCSGMLVSVGLFCRMPAHVC